MKHHQVQVLLESANNPELSEALLSAFLHDHGRAVVTLEVGCVSARFTVTGAEVRPAVESHGTLRCDDGGASSFEARELVEVSS